MEKKMSISSLLCRLRKSYNKQLFLNEIEEDYGKEVLIDLMTADYTDRLLRKGFNVSLYLVPYKSWNSYEKMKLLHLRIQEMENPIIKSIINIIQTANKSLTNQQKIESKNKMQQMYFARLVMVNHDYLFKIDEEYYDVLSNIYSREIPNIFF